MSEVKKPNIDEVTKPVADKPQVITPTAPESDELDEADMDKVAGGGRPPVFA